jgi:hypothetical protein
LSRHARQCHSTPRPAYEMMSDSLLKVPPPHRWRYTYVSVAR